MYYFETISCFIKKYYLLYTRPTHFFDYQVVVGSFIADGKKSKSSGPSPTPAQPSSSNMLNFGGTGMGGSPSPGDSSDSGDDENDDTSLNHGYGAQAGPGQTMPMYSPMGWPNSMKILPN